MNERETNNMRKFIMMLRRMGDTGKQDGLFYCLDCSRRFPLDVRVTHVEHLSPDIPEYNEGPVDIWEFCPTCYAERFHHDDGGSN